MPSCANEGLRSDPSAPLALHNSLDHFFCVNHDALGARPICLHHHIQAPTPCPYNEAMKMIGLLLEDYFDEREVIYPYYRVQEAGFGVVVIGPKVTSYHGKTPYSMEATIAASDVKSEDLAGLIVPGGFAPDRIRRVKAMTDLIREIDEQKKPLGAICHAGWALISAGVVKGRTLTGFSSIREDLVNAGANYVDQKVVTDGNLVTAQHADDLPAFTKAFVDLF